MRSKREHPPGPVQRALASLITAPALLSFLFPVIVIVASKIAWDRWGRQRIAGELAGIKIENVHINESPRPIRDGVVETVFRDMEMERWSVLDRGVTAKTAAAFEMHPWVRDVRSVRKRSEGHLDIHVEYRKPVAMVKVRKPGQKDTSDYYFPVDDDGIVLPEVDFKPSQTDEFLHVIVEDAFTYQPWGMPFGDHRVEAAAKLAGILCEHRDRWDVEAIVCNDDPRLMDVPLLELRFRDGSRVTWGSPPGREFSKEANVAAKIDALETGRGRRDGMDLRRAQRVAAR